MTANLNIHRNMLNPTELKTKFLFTEDPLGGHKLEVQHRYSRGKSDL